MERRMERRMGVRDIVFELLDRMRLDPISMLDQPDGVFYLFPRMCAMVVMHRGPLRGVVIGMS